MMPRVNALPPEGQHEKEQSIMDARGLTCPLPVLKAARALRTLPAGSVLTLLSTDRTSLTEIPDMCEKTGHRLISVTEHADHIVFLLQSAQ